jgi:hypothetical protein
MTMKLAVTLILAVLPFLGVAVLFWRPMQGSWAMRLRRAGEQHDLATAAQEDAVTRLQEGDERLMASQQRLGDELGE